MASAQSSASQKPKYETQMAPPARTLCACNGARARGQSLCVPPYSLQCFPGQDSCGTGFPRSQCAHGRGGWGELKVLFSHMLLPPHLTRCMWMVLPWHLNGPFRYLKHMYTITCIKQSYFPYREGSTIPIIQNPSGFLEFLRNYFKNCVSEKRHRRKDKWNAH